ncbi:MAG TPA: hypothetical protein ENH13_00695 [Euryarchaeota archaeon]|nr:hypothetical protein BMS3Abin16_01198 [archaeon BMS3Abin16]GBE56432.1 hypothetical protein BMS3Bbin16_00637 [archaeon BMS3Bbin16]HDH27628.1 hypothetical protein [Euryarchaeota archaeon]HDY74391.1 hypothetical protein [Euryarchaeota archaeon]
MAHFNKQDMLVGQLYSHHGLNEIYGHLIVAAILFLVSVVCAALLYRLFQKTQIEWPALLYAFIYTGLIGLGEFAEHFFTDTFLNTVLHYTHLLAAPGAMVFFYLAIREYHYKCSYPDEELNTVSNEASMGVFVTIITITVLLGGLAGTPWDETLEGPVLIVILLPMIALSALLIRAAGKIDKSNLTVYFPVFGAVLSGLTLTIWIGRFADVHQIAMLYIAAHSLQNVFHAGMATLILLFTRMIRREIRDDTLFKCRVNELSKHWEKKLEPKRRFNLDEQ